MKPADKARLESWLSDTIAVIRYGLREDANYCSYPANHEDLECLEELRRAVAEAPTEENGIGAELYCLVKETGSHALRGAISALLSTREARGKPLTESDCRVVTAILRSNGRDPEVWVRILQSWFLYDDGEAFEEALSQALEKHEKETSYDH